ncbi:hypothetical protein VPH35_109633 [Triticum aestivum]
MYQAIPYSVGRLPACPRRSEQAEAEGAVGQEGGLAARRRGGEGRRRGGGEEGRGREPGASGGEARVLPQPRGEAAAVGVGVNPAMQEVTDDDELTTAGAGNAGGEAVVALPAVFVGGRLLGGLDRLMAVHIFGELVPILKDAGALWL